MKNKKETKIIQVKLSMILGVAVPCDASSEIALDIIKGQMELMGHNSNKIVLTIDESEDMPELIDELI